MRLYLCDAAVSFEPSSSRFSVLETRQRMPLITFPYPVRTRYIFATHAHGQHSIVPQAVMVVSD